MIKVSSLAICLLFTGCGAVVKAPLNIKLKAKCDLSHKSDLAKQGAETKCGIVTELEVLTIEHLTN